MPALDRLRAAGFEVAIAPDDGLMVRPAERLTDAQRAWLKAHKAALLAALASEQPAPRPADVVGMVGLVGLGQTDSDVHLPAPRPADVVGMVALVGLGQTDSDVHLPAAPAPLLPADEARIRRYLTRIGEVDPVTIAELLDVCRRDAEARIATLALAIESESQPAPPPPPPKLAARQTPEQRQRCFAARVGEFMRAGMTLDDATAATAKEGW